MAPTAAAQSHRFNSWTTTMRRTLLLSSLYVLALAMLALPYGITA